MAFEGVIMTESTHKHAHKAKKESNIWKIATIALLVIIVLYFGAQQFEAPGVESDSAPTAPSGGEAEEFVYEAGDAPSLGDADAPVTVVEFSDFQCPFCARVVPTIKQIKDEYVDSGKVRIV